MPRKSKDERARDRVRLLEDIAAKRPHTHSTAILAPLSQAGLITYKLGSRGAKDVKVTDEGQFYIGFMKSELGIKP